MAKAKKETNIPSAFIDYEGQSGIDWTGSDLIDYWSAELLRNHRIGGRIWTVKEKTMAARLVKEYTEDELKKMIKYWMSAKESNGVANFIMFYAHRREINQHIQPKNYDWD